MRVGVTGHQQLPDLVEQLVVADLSSRYAGRRGLRCVSSLAAGADQLVARELLRLGAALEVVVPSQGYAALFTSPVERRAYEGLLAEASEVTVLAFRAPSEDAFLAAGYEVVERSDEVVAVWDGLPARGRGGTADVVEYAENLGLPVRVLWPAGVVRE